MLDIIFPCPFTGVDQGKMYIYAVILVAAVEFVLLQGWSKDWYRVVMLWHNIFVH